MSEQPDQGVYNMSDQRLRQLHLYKELMSPEERRDRYTLLRLSGATRSQAQSWRDWSPNHYQMMLTYLCNPPDLQPALPGPNSTELTA
jgi:hypothetical protein